MENVPLTPKDCKKLFQIMEAFQDQATEAVADHPCTDYCNVEGELLDMLAMNMKISDKKIDDFMDKAMDAGLFTWQVTMSLNWGSIQRFAEDWKKEGN